MSPEPPGGPAAPRPLLLLLGPPALLLLLRAAAVRGDCGLPPVIPHAQPVLGGSTTFPENATVLYTCDQDFVKIPGMADAVVCLSNDKWTDIEEFCNRSCDVPPRLSYAALKRTYISKNYFPVGTIVEYECRPGHKRVYPLVGKITCLDNLTWSTPATFCEKKPCPNPGEILNGYVNVTTDLLFGSQIFFSCDVGYRLHGVDSAFCMITGNAVDWSNRFPVCIKILCPEPPQIKNGRIINEEDTYEYGQVVTYECDRKFTLTGKKHISCTVKGDTGEWSDPAPECKGTSPPPFIPPQKPSTTNVPATEAPLPPQKPTIVNIPATRPGPDSRTTTKSTTASEEKGLPSGHIGPICGGVVGVTIIGTIALVTYFWNRGKSGMKSAGTKKINYKTHENNKAPNVMFHNLSETDGTSEIRPPSDKLLKDTHI
ncbi:complement decay-accelerating factor [Erethizon dorsatum]